MARPTKYTPATVKRICDAITKGATYELAAAYGGITYETFNEWRKDKPGFSDALSRAEAEGAMTMLELIDAAAPTDWRAAAWKLERRHPQMYGKTVTEGKLTHEHSGPEGQSIPIAILFDSAAAIAEIAGGPGEDRTDS